MSKSIEEITADIVVAAINSQLPKVNAKIESATLPLTVDDIPKLINEVYSALLSCDSKQSVPKVG